MGFHQNVFSAPVQLRQEPDCPVYIYFDRYYKDITLLPITEQYRFSSPQINWNGDILGCSVNKWRSLGNVFTSTLSEWQQSPAYKALVSLLFEGQLSDIDLPCKYCPNLSKVMERPLTEDGLAKYNDYIAPALKS